MPSISFIYIWYLAFFVCLLAGLAALYYLRKRSGAGLLLVKGNLLEQQLLFEAISSSVQENTLSGLITALTRNLAEITGYGYWLVLLQNNNSEFIPFADNIDQVESPERIGLTDFSKLSAWIRYNDELIRFSGVPSLIKNNECLNSIFQTMEKGIIVPFTDKRQLMGYVLLGGKTNREKNRSRQFFSLYGALAAIAIKQAMLLQHSHSVALKTRRAETLSNMGTMAASLAHELKNPLAFIRSGIDLITSTNMTRKNKDNLGKQLVTEVGKLSSRIEELLSLSQLNPSHFITLNLTSLLDEVVNTLAIMASEKEIALCHVAAAKNIMISGDADKLWQLFENLIMNAIQACGRGDSITVTTRIPDKKVTIEITDTGPGIPIEYQEKVFNPFFTTKSNGTGLGLAICLSIAQAHEGSLELVDTNGEGTTILVSMPMA